MSLTRPLVFSLFAATTVLTGCNNASAPVETPVSEQEVKVVKPIIKDDKFTYSNYDEVRVTHVDLNLDVNFDAKVLDGIATIDFERVKAEADTLVLDTKDLTIKSVRLFAGGEAEEAVEYTLGEDDEVLGGQ